MHTPRKPFSLSNIIFYVFALIIFALAIHFASRIRNVEQTFEHIQPLWIVLAIVAQVMTYVFNALIFYVLLGRKGGQVPMKDLFKIAIVSLFVSQILPSGGLSGTGFVFDELVDRGVETKQAFRAIVVQAFSSYIALIGILYASGIVYALLGHPIPHLFYIVIMVGTIFYAILATVMVIIGKPRVLAFAERKLSRLKFIERYLKKINFLSVADVDMRPVKTFLGHKRDAFFVILLQSGVFIADAVTLLALVFGLGLRLNFISILFALMLTLVIAALPTLPGALIVYEGSMTFFYTTLGLPVAGALAVTLLYRTLSFWLPIPIGLVLYRRMTKREEIPNSST